MKCPAGTRLAPYCIKLRISKVTHWRRCRKLLSETPLSVPVLFQSHTLAPVQEVDFGDSSLRAGPVPNSRVGVVAGRCCLRLLSPCRSCSHVKLRMKFPLIHCNCVVPYIYHQSYQCALVVAPPSTHRPRLLPSLRPTCSLHLTNRPGTLHQAYPPSKTEWGWVPTPVLAPLTAPPRQEHRRTAIALSLDAPGPGPTATSTPRPARTQPSLTVLLHDPDPNPTQGLTPR